MKKIAFDAKRAAQNFTGLGNYSRFVIDGLSRSFLQDEYLLYTPSARKARLLGDLVQRDNCRVCYPESKLWRMLPSLWRSGGICTQLKKDAPVLFHGLSNELPQGIERTGIKSVVTIHDLIFLRYPRFYPLLERNIYAYKFRRACQIADRVVAVSECTKRDIVHYFGIPEQKIEVVYQGCDDGFLHPASEQQKERARAACNLPEKYLLNVGSIESRKNLMLAVKALEHARCDLPLVVLGRHTPYTDQVCAYARKQGLSDRLIILHGVAFQHFPAIYQMASLFLYPSFYEGFGIPILEALNSRIPVIGAMGSCLEEAGGPDSLYVDPNDERALAHAIDRVLGDDSLRQEMVLRGVEYAKRFDRERLTRQIARLYDSL